MSTHRERCAAHVGCLLALLGAGCGQAEAGGAGRDGGGDGRRAADAATAEPFAVEVVDFEAGEGAGFGQELLPQIVLGPPRGGGHHTGSTHVVSLGVGGTIVVELGAVVVDGPGIDLLVFENAFRVGGSAGPTYAEPGHVAVSEDGESFTEFPCEPAQSPEYPGCGGVRPVLANVESNDLDPTDPQMAGGDRFDLADIGVERARFVRIRDAGVSPRMGGGSAGFDLDAVAVVQTE